MQRPLGRGLRVKGRAQPAPWLTCMEACARSERGPQTDEDPTTYEDAPTRSVRQTSLQAGCGQGNTPPAPLREPRAQWLRSLGEGSTQGFSFKSRHRWKGGRTWEQAGPRDAVQGCVWEQPARRACAQHGSVSAASVAAPAAASGCSGLAASPWSSGRYLPVARMVVS